MQTIYKASRAKLSMCIFLSTLLISSCKKLVDIPPPTDQIVDNNVYTNNATAISVLTGLYTAMSSDGFFTGLQSLSLLAGLSADELSLHSNATSITHISYYSNALSPNSVTGSEFWKPLYNYIYKCNAAVEGLQATNTLTPAVKKQLLGEVKFMRAFYYFYLVELFGDVPLATTTDYKVNTLLSRTPKTQVYHQIIEDLKEAQNLLSIEYLNENLQPYTDIKERLRPTKWAATALLARVYLYAGDYIDAEAQSTTVINNSSLYTLSPLADAFTMNSQEAIWQLQPVIIGHNTEDAWTFIIPSTGPNDQHPVFLSPQLLAKFETADLRRTEWIGSVEVAGTTYHYPFKYKSAILDEPLTEYLIVLRLGEQFLIRSEARAQQNNIPGAQSDLNMIRVRANLSNTPATDKASLLIAIQNERQIELFSEWGHRWLDLKRTNNIDAVMHIVTPLKNNAGAWQSYQQLYPLPLSDIESAPNLVQNPGY